MYFSFTVSIWAVPREAQWWLTAFEGWTDRERERKANFRMRKTTFLNLCDILRPSLVQQQCHCRKALSVEQQVAIYLWRLATNIECRLSLSTAPAVFNSEWSAMKSQLTFTPEVLTFCTLYNHCDYYYLTMLVIYEHLGHVLLYSPPGTARSGLATPQSLVPL